MLSRLAQVGGAEEIVPMEVGVIDSYRVAASRDSNEGKSDKFEAAQNNTELPNVVEEQKIDTKPRQLRKTLDNFVV